MSRIRSSRRLGSLAGRLSVVARRLSDAEAAHEPALFAQLRILRDEHANWVDK